jgi:hypothetical protein
MDPVRAKEIYRPAENRTHGRPVNMQPRYKSVIIALLRGLQSANELYRLSDRRMSTKFSTNFCG